MPSLETKKTQKPALLPQPLQPYLVFAVVFIGLSTLSRIALSAFNLSRLETDDNLIWLFLFGLRIDLVVVGQVVVIPMLISIATYNLKPFRKLWHTCVRIYLSLFLACFVGLELMTPTFFNEYNTRPNYLLFEYLAYPDEVISMLWNGYRLQVLVIPVLMVLAGLFGYRLLRSRSQNPDSLPWTKLSALFIGAVVINALMIRSSFDHRPINPSKVAFSDNTFVNELTLNSFYSSAYSMYIKARFDKSFKPAFSMPLAQVKQLVKSPTPESDAQPDQPPTDTTSTANKPKHKNIVVLLEESLGAEFVGSLGGADLTPNIDQMKDNSLWFEHLYATGTRSVRGIEAVIAGFPPTTSRSVLKLPKSQHNFFTFACELNRYGYESTFIYGGESHFDNMKAFLLNNCFDQVIDERDFHNPIFKGSWGVSDEDIFAKTDEYLSMDHAKPQFVFVFTVSNHSPWDYPEGRIQTSPENAHTRSSAVRYADYAFGQFVQTARKGSYWDDSLFLLVADHNSRIFGAEQIPIKNFHIPGIIFGGGVKAQRVDTIASQIDLLPTLYGLAGLPPSQIAIGWDILKTPPSRGRAVMQYYDTQAYMEGEQVIVIKDNRLEYYLYDAQNDHLTRAQPLPEDMKQRAIAMNLWPQYMYHQQLYSLNKAPDTAHHTLGMNH